ncbi:MAG: hypothetical protein DWQ02_10675, partial [Bacteroidetes bacterium]
KNGFHDPALRSFLILVTVHLIGQLVLFFRFYGVEQQAFWELTSGNLTFMALWTVLFGVLSLLSMLGSSSGRERIQKLTSRIFVFHFVVIGWIFFRSGALGAPLPSLQVTNELIGQILVAFQPELIMEILGGYKTVFALTALGFVLHFLPEKINHGIGIFFEKAPAPIHILTLSVVIWISIQAAGSEVVPFIYFQF